MRGNSVGREGIGSCPTGMRCAQLGEAWRVIRAGVEVWEMVITAIWNCRLSHLSQYAEL